MHSTADDSFKAAVGGMYKRTSQAGAEGSSPDGNRFDLMMQSAFRKRMGTDYLSERSGIIGINNNGIDMRKYQPEVILHKLDKYKTKGKKIIMSRDSLIEFVAQEYNVSMTMLSATDAILFCRGPALDNSEQYNEEKLVHWL